MSTLRDRVMDFLFGYATQMGQTREAALDSAVDMMLGVAIGVGIARTHPEVVDELLANIAPMPEGMIDSMVSGDHDRAVETLGKMLSKLPSNTRPN